MPCTGRYPAPMTDDASAAPVEPDTKDWTWVLDQPCAECGYDAATCAAASSNSVATWSGCWRS